MTPTAALAAMSATPRTTRPRPARNNSAAAAVATIAPMNRFIAPLTPTCARHRSARQANAAFAIQGAPRGEHSPRGVPSGACRELGGLGLVGRGGRATSSGCGAVPSPWRPRRRTGARRRSACRRRSSSCRPGRAEPSDAHIPGSLLRKRSTSRASPHHWRANHTGHNAEDPRGRSGEIWCAVYAVHAWTRVLSLTLAEPSMPPRSFGARRGASRGRAAARTGPLPTAAHREALGADSPAR